MPNLNDDEVNKVRSLLDAAYPSKAVPLKLPASPGYRTVLFGDSMTDFNFTVVNPTSAVYNPSTGVLTLTESGGHFKWKGAYINFWNRSYTSTYNMRRYQVASIVSSTVYTINIGAGLTDLPNGALSGTHFAVTYQHRCSKSWLTWLNALGGQRFNVVYNGAQSGDTTVDARARLQRDCLDWKPQVVVMQSLGINDLTLDTITTRNDVQRVCSNLRYIYDQILDSGAFLILGLLTPVASGDVRGQIRIMAAKDAINKFIWRYAQANPNVLVLDTNASIVDPTSATGLAKSGVLSATDFIHYSNVGGYRTAKAALAAIQAKFPSVVSTLPKSHIDACAQTLLTTPTGVVSSGVLTITSASAYVQKGQELFIKGATGSYTGLNGRWIAYAASAAGSFTILTPGLPDGSVTGTLAIWTSRQLFPEPLLQTTSGGTLSNGVTGTAANNINCYNNAGSALAACVASVGAEPGGFGNEQILTLTASSLNDQPGVKFENSIGTVDNRMFPGRTYILECQVRLASTDWSATPLSEIGVQLNFTANGTGEAWRVTDLNQYEAVIPLNTANETLHVRTAPITIPTDTVSIDSCQMNVWARAQAAQVSGTLTLGFSRFAVHDVTPDEEPVTMLAA